MNIFCLFLNLRLSTFHKTILRFFAQRCFAKRGKVPLLIALLLDSSGCDVNRAWVQREIRKGTLLHASRVK